MMFATSDRRRRSDVSFQFLPRHSQKMSDRTGKSCSWSGTSTVPYFSTVKSNSFSSDRVLQRCLSFNKCIAFQNSSPYVPNFHEKTLDSANWNEPSFELKQGLIEMSIPTTYASVVKKPPVSGGDENKSNKENVKKPAPTNRFNKLGMPLGVGSLPNVHGKDVGSNDVSDFPNAKIRIKQTINKLDLLRGLIGLSGFSNVVSVGLGGSAETFGCRRQSDEQKPSDILLGPACSNEPNSMDSKISTEETSCLSEDRKHSTDDDEWTSTQSDSRGHVCRNAQIAFIMGFEMSSSEDEDDDDSFDDNEWDLVFGEGDDTEKLAAVHEECKSSGFTKTETEECDSEDEVDYAVIKLSDVCSNPESLLPFHRELSNESLRKVNSNWDRIYGDIAVAAKENRKVFFADDVSLVLVHAVPTYNRKGPWEEVARDRYRFKKRIQETEVVLGKVFDPSHRRDVYEKRILPLYSRT